MIGLTSEITDEVSFGWWDHHLHLCLQMKQVWNNAGCYGINNGCISMIKITNVSNENIQLSESQNETIPSPWFMVL